MVNPLEGVFGRYALEFFADSKGLKVDLEKLELQATKSATGIERSLATGFNAGVTKAREGMGSMAEFAGTQFGRVAAYVTSPIVAIAGLSAAVGAFTISAIKDAVEFDRAFNQVRLQLIGTGTDLGALKSKLLDLTPSMATASEKAGALGQVLSKGFNPDESVKLLDIASKLSRVTGVDLNTAAELLTETLRAYGLGVQDAERISNTLLTTLQKAGGPQGVGNMIAGLGRIIPVANELHIPLEQVTAALVTMQQQGIEGSRAAMALAMILGRATTEAQKFRDAGVDIYKVAATEGIPGVLREIRRVAGPTNEDLRSMGIEARTLNVMLALAGEGAGRFRDNLAAAGKLSLNKLAEETNTITKSQMNLNTAWEDFKVSLGTVAIPPLAILLDAVAKWVALATGQKPIKGPFSVTWEDLGYEPTEVERQAKQTAAAARQAGRKALEGIAGKSSLRGGAAERIQEGLDAQTAEKKSNIEKAADRERLERQSKTYAESNKLQQDAAIQSLTLDRQIAEARKASEIDLLTFDRQILDTRLRFEDQQRAARLETIKEELALVPEGDPKARLALESERQRLILEGTNAHEKAEKERTLITEKETKARLTIEDAELASRKTRGEVTLQEEVDLANRRAQAFLPGTVARLQAEDQAFKLARDMADRLFAHEQTLGMRSLREAIEREKDKAAAAVATSTQRMDAEDKAYAHEQELREKSNSAALELLERIKKYAEEKGEDTGYFTPSDLQRWFSGMQMEQGGKAAQAQRFAAGGGTSIDVLEEGLKAGGQLAKDQATFRLLGGIPDIFKAGSEVQPGPVTQALGTLGAQLTNRNFWQSAGPEGDIGEGYSTGMEKALDAVDTGLTKIEARFNESNSRIGKAVATNMEKWFVDKLMDQADRN